MHYITAKQICLQKITKFQKYYYILYQIGACASHIGEITVTQLLPYRSPRGNDPETKDLCTTRYRGLFYGKEMIV